MQWGIHIELHGGVAVRLRVRHLAQDPHPEVRLALLRVHLHVIGDVDRIVSHDLPHRDRLALPDCGVVEAHARLRIHHAVHHVHAAREPLVLPPGGLVVINVRVQVEDRALLGVVLGEGDLPDVAIARDVGEVDIVHIRGVRSSAALVALTAELVLNDELQALVEVGIRAEFQLHVIGDAVGIPILRGGSHAQ